MKKRISSVFKTPWSLLLLLWGFKKSKTNPVIGFVFSLRLRSQKAANSDLNKSFFEKRIFYANLWWIGKKSSSVLVAHSLGWEQRESGFMTIKIFYGYWGLPAYIRCRLRKVQSLIPSLAKWYTHHVLLLMQCKIFKLKSHSGNPSSQQRGKGKEIALEMAKQIWCKIKKLKSFRFAIGKSINDAYRKITPQDDVVHAQKNHPRHG